jgi:hypothetical protein
VPRLPVCACRWLCAAWSPLSDCFRRWVRLATASKRAGSLPVSSGAPPDVLSALTSDAWSLPRRVARSFLDLPAVSCWSELAAKGNRRVRPCRPVKVRTCSFRRRVGIVNRSRGFADVAPVGCTFEVLKVAQPSNRAGPGFNHAKEEASGAGDSPARYHNCCPASAPGAVGLIMEHVMQHVMEHVMDMMREINIYVHMHIRSANREFTERPSQACHSHAQRQ